MKLLSFVWRRSTPLVAAGLLACSGCQSGRHLAGNQDAGPAPEAHEAVTGSLLRPGLTVNVQVLVAGQKEVDEKNRRISELCSITLPLIGDVSMTNMTVREAQDVLKKLYRRYYVDPQVIVECQMEAGDAAVSPWGYVTVLGRVKKPGQVNVPPTSDLTVSRAIQLAGGLDTSANSTTILVTRKHDNSKEQFEVNLDQIGARGQVKDDIRLLPGDVVYVPEMIF